MPPFISAPRTPVGYQQLTVSSTAVGLTLPAGADPADYVIISVGSNPIRYRDDGTNPTSAVGMPLAAGSYLEYDGNLNSIRFIRQSADAILDILYYQNP